MGRTVDGVSTIYVAAKVICRMVKRFGTSALAVRVSEEFAVAVVALVAACDVFDASDDQPLKVDRLTPFGHEDVGEA